MNVYSDVLTTLSMDVNITIYLCVLNQNSLLTFHEGQSFSDTMPEWMMKYVKGSATIYPFEQDSKKKQYCKWVLDENNIIVFIDDSSFVVQNTLIRQLLTRNDLANKISVLTSNVEQLNKDNMNLSSIHNDLVETYKKLVYNADADGKIIEKLNNEILSLKDQNNDQGLRLKKSLEENLSNSRYRRESAFEKPAVKGIDIQEEYQKDLSFVIKSLNNIVLTGDASSVSDIKLFTGISSDIERVRDLERNPIMVKTLITRIISLDREGKLTAPQLRLLARAFKQSYR